MARFTHTFTDPSQMRADLELIPGLIVDRNALQIHGGLDAIEAGGARVSKVLEAMYPKDAISIENALPNLRAYQQSGANWLYFTMKQHKGAILADDMGLGKTRTALYASTLVPNNYFTLVVAPANVAPQWQEEANVLGLPVEVLGAK